MKKLFLVYSLFFLVAEAYPFTVISQNGSEVKWKDHVVNYCINSSGSDDFQEGFDGAGNRYSEFRAIEASFLTWQNVNGINITVNNTGTTQNQNTGMDGLNEVIWVEQNWRSLPFRPPEGALAVTISSFDFNKGEIVDSDIHFNGEFFNWAHIDSNEENAKIDIVSIATHEIGHLLGLNHSSEDLFETSQNYLDSTMYYSENPGETKARSLEDDDIKGIMHIYGSNNNYLSEPTAASIYPEQGVNVLTSELFVAVQISGENFSPNAVVKLANPALTNIDIIAREVQVISQSQITCKFDLRGKAPGKYDLIVSNSNEKIDILKNGFEIIDGNVGNYMWQGGGYNFAPQGTQQPQAQVPNQYYGGNTQQGQYLDQPAYGCTLIKGIKKDDSSISLMTLLFGLFAIIIRARFIKR